MAYYGVDNALSTRHIDNARYVLPLNVLCPGINTEVHASVDIYRVSSVKLGQSQVCPGVRQEKIGILVNSMARQP